MKKKFVITSVILVVVLFAGLGVNYLLSLRKVSFSLKSTTEAISVHDIKDKEIGRLSSDGQLLLQSGNYYVIPEGENISSDKIEFTVKNRDVSITINPSYTEEYLAETLRGEMDTVEAALAAKYPQVFDGYTLSKGTLYKQGDWFGGLLKPEVTDIRQQKDPYRVVLHKSEGEWEVIRRPEYVLTSSRYEEVPIDVLREINLLVGEPGN